MQACCAFLEHGCVVGRSVESVGLPWAPVDMDITSVRSDLMAQVTWVMGQERGVVVGSEQCGRKCDFSAGAKTWEMDRGPFPHVQQWCSGGGRPVRGDVLGYKLMQDASESKEG